ncbi:MAG: nitrilase family protein [Azospirillaceae bacterium]|nr:nitrilase family protein [Azospirillaceae bacterium]
MEDIPESRVRIACLQMRPEWGAVATNVSRSVGLIAAAAAAGATIVVLPELCSTGYVFASRDEAFAVAEELPHGSTAVAWIEAARRHRVIVVAGIAERADNRLYNAALIAGPEGPIGIYRKNHLWGAEALFFEPGNLGFPVFHTAAGRLAVAICYDLWFPETFRMAALQGADLLCVPTNWVPMAAQSDSLPAMANILMMAGAHSNSLFVAAADRVGVERDQAFVGRSLIVDCAGWPAAGPAGADAEEMIVADVNLADARRKRRWNDFNQILRDRRTDLYDEMLGTGLKRGWY